MRENKTVRARCGHAQTVVFLFAVLAAGLIPAELVAGDYEQGSLFAGVLKDRSTQMNIDGSLGFGANLVEGCYLCTDPWSQAVLWSENELVSIVGGGFNRLVGQYLTFPNDFFPTDRFAALGFQADYDLLEPFIGLSIPGEQSNYSLLEL